jgi:hypothetical protein
MSDATPTKPDHAATLRAWRERGADRVHPVRFSFLEGLVRRAASQSGAARQLLDEKIAGLMASYGEELVRSPVASQVTAAAPASAPVSAAPPAHASARVPAPSPALALSPAPAPSSAPAPVPSRAPTHTPSPAATSAHADVPSQTRAPARAHAAASSRASTRAPAPALTLPPAPRGPLGTLADLINHQRIPAPADTPSAAPISPSTPAPFPSELKALDDVRNTWARLDAEQRLEQALAQVPTNAGPLNSYHLVLRTLTLMRDVSPEYLQRFMGYVDALMWLERAAP